MKSQTSRRNKIKIRAEINDIETEIKQTKRKQNKKNKIKNPKNPKKQKTTMATITTKKNKTKKQPKTQWNRSMKPGAGYLKRSIKLINL